MAAFLKNSENNNHNRNKSDSERVIRRTKYTGVSGGLRYIAIIVCLAVILAFFGWMVASDMLSLNKDDIEVVVTLPESIFSTETVNVVDEDGNITGTEEVTYADVGYIAGALHSAGLVRYKWLFKYYCAISNAYRLFDPGEYELLGTYDYRALVQHMRKSSAIMKTVTVTIPEGFTMNDIFKRLEENGVASYDDLMYAAEHSTYKYWFVEENTVGGAERLEGYLFPDTYEFYVGMEPSSAINKMLQNFESKFTDDMREAADYRGLTVHQVLTVASMIEKETASDDERPMVSSVIYNRLGTGWTLGFDSTILYVHQDHEGEPTAEMLEEDSPYNTRLYGGLPPTPICSPGLASIQAALYPSTTYYWYFAADKETGELHFFEDQNNFNYFVQSQNYDE